MHIARRNASMPVFNNSAMRGLHHSNSNRRRLGQLPQIEMALFGKADPRLAVDQTGIPGAIARAGATFDARVPECLSLCDGLSTAPPIAGEKSEKERCFNLCQGGSVADPVTAGRNQARCAAIVHDPANAPLFMGDVEMAWSNCVGDPDGFVASIQNAGLPLANATGDVKPWYKRPSTWIIAGAAVAAGAIVLYA